MTHTLDRLWSENAELKRQLVEADLTIRHLTSSCASLLTRAEQAEAERDEARQRFNEIDLCHEGQAPCAWALKLIEERDTMQKNAERYQTKREADYKSMNYVGMGAWDNVSLAQHKQRYFDAYDDAIDTAKGEKP